MRVPFIAYADFESFTAVNMSTKPGQELHQAVSETHPQRVCYHIK